jgi:hypothetical protein
MGDRPQNFFRKFTGEKGCKVLECRKIWKFLNGEVCMAKEAAKGFHKIRGQNLWLKAAVNLLHMRRASLPNDFGFYLLGLYRFYWLPATVF